MRKCLLHIIFLLFTSATFYAQINDAKIIIDGHVKGSDAKMTYTVINAAIHLTTDAGDEIVAYSDTTGYYSFSFQKTPFKKATISIVSSNKTRGIGDRRPCYLASRDFAEIILPKDGTPKHYIKDFELTRVSHCDEPYIPRIMFKNQSAIYDTVFASSYYEKSDSLLDIPQNGLFRYGQILKDYPALVVQISGHSSFNEKMPFELANLRAEKIKLELIKMGISPDRIVIKNCGDSRPMVRPAEIKRAKTKEERSYLHGRNRRCTLSVISWDYGKTPEQLKKEEEAEKLKNKEDE